MIQDLFSLALNNLRKRGIRSYLTMLGIFLGIAAVVSLISLGNGLQEAITGQFGVLDADKLIVQNADTGFGPPGALAVARLTEHDLDLVSSTSGVRHAIPRLVRIGKVEFNDESAFHYVGSTSEDPEELQVLYDDIDTKIELGRQLETSDKGKVVLGNDFLDKEKFGKQLSPGSKIEVQGKQFEVIGFFERASSFTINSVVFMLESDMKDLLDIDDEIDVILVQVQDENKILDIADNIERKFRKDRNVDLGEEDFSVQTPEQGLETINTILGIINLVVAGIAAIALLIGGIGIANTMYTSVLERTREIGTMKAIGATNGAILIIFMIESALLGLVGGIIGALIGLAMAFAASSAASIALGGLDFNVTISYPLLTASVLFSLTIGVLSGIIPAIQASRLNPTEALRR
jgi:putative ABC transport system permease protein